MAKFAERLDLALAKRGFTGAQVANALTEAGIPITRAYVSQLRTGKQTNPTLQVLRALAACLQVSVGWLVGEDHVEVGPGDDPNLQAAGLAQFASGLSEDSLSVVRGVIELARKAENLPENPEPALEIPEAAAPLSEPVRRAVGERLHSLRMAAQMSVEKVEAALGKGAIALEAVEEGRIAPAPATVERLLTLYGVTAVPAREYVLSLARGERELEWYDSSAFPVWLATTCSIDSRASVIRTYHTHFVPPLLQTEDYALAAIATADQGSFRHTTADAAVDILAARQRLILGPKGPVVWAVMDEGVLLRTIAEKSVLLDQLDRLIDFAKRPNISLHIVPMEDPAYVPRTGPFTLWRFDEAFEPDIACSHALEADELITDAVQVEAYHQAFTKLSVTTTTRDETLDLLYAHRERLSRSAGN